MGYTKSEIIVMAQETSKDISTFYKSNFINYRGITSDTHEYCTEVVAEWLLLKVEISLEASCAITIISLFV